MPKKKSEADDEPIEAPEFEPSDFGVGPDDPNYQKPAFATPEQMAVLDKGPEARAAAVLKDHQAMGSR